MSLDSRKPTIRRVVLLGAIQLALLLGYQFDMLAALCTGHFADAQVVGTSQQFAFHGLFVVVGQIGVG